MIESNSFILMKMINDRFEARANYECQKVDLTIAQFRVLVHLINNSDKQITQKDLELAFNVSHPTINGILKRMEDKNFITTELVRDKKQQRFVYISEKGKTAITQMQNILTFENTEMNKLFTEAEMQQFNEYLSRIFMYLSE